MRTNRRKYILREENNLQILRLPETVLKKKDGRKKFLRHCVCRIDQAAQKQRRTSLFAEVKISLLTEVLLSVSKVDEFYVLCEIGS